MLNNKTFFIILSMIVINIFFVSCSSILPTKDEEKKEVKIHQTQGEALEIPKLNVEVVPESKCKIENFKYNLTVNAPKNSRIRIMNIKPKYKDCIALKKGKYHIEVTKKGFQKYLKWIYIDANLEMNVKLKKIKMDNYIDEKNELEKAAYNIKALEDFIKKYPKSTRVVKAKKRVDTIKNLFKNYSPHALIKSNNCIGFYPKSLVEKMLNISTPMNYWDNIKWSGSCDDELMSGRGVLYFSSNKDLHVELKGKMKNGFFKGKVYNSSRANDKTLLIEGHGVGNFTVKLKNRFDFIHYQE